MSVSGASPFAPDDEIDEVLIDDPVLVDPVEVGVSANRRMTCSVDAAPMVRGVVVGLRRIVLELGAPPIRRAARSSAVMLPEDPARPDDGAAVAESPDRGSGERRTAGEPGASGELDMSFATCSARRSSGPRWSSSKNRGAGEG